MGDLSVLREMDFQGLYMGGVAYKSSQRNLTDRLAANKAVAAADQMHVVVTSGPRTGVPPEPSKLKKMRMAVGPTGRLGIASGVTAENIRDFLPYVDVILVSTGINADYHTIDSTRLNQLMEEVRSFKA